GAIVDDGTAVKTLESLVDAGIRIIGSGVEIFGVLIIVTGIAWSTIRQLRQRIPEQDFGCLQGPHRPLAPARPRGAGGCRYRENHRARVDPYEPSPARRPGAGSHLSELDTGAGNRGPVAVAPKTISHVVESSRRKGCRYAMRQRHAGCGRVTAGGGGDRAAQGCPGATGLARDDEDRSKTWAFGCREPCRGATDR